MKKFLINFFAVSCGVWFLFILLYGGYVVAFNGHWPVSGLIGFSCIVAVFLVLLPFGKLSAKGNDYEKRA